MFKYFADKKSSGLAYGVKFSPQLLENSPLTAVFSRS